LRRGCREGRHRHQEIRAAVICEFCRGAGRLNQNLLIVESDDREVYKSARRAAKGMHYQCKGGTWCDCQHHVGRATHVKLEVK
jgi:ribosomal protein RSM22 (predicted rRNA methylase)